MLFKDAFDSLTKKFTSGNHIVVERTTILREEWEAILAHLAAIEKMQASALSITEEMGKALDQHAKTIQDIKTDLAAELKRRELNGTV